MALAVHDLRLLRPRTIVIVSRREEKAAIAILLPRDLLQGMTRHIERLFHAHTTGAPLVWIW